MYLKQAPSLATLARFVDIFLEISSSVSRGSRCGVRVILFLVGRVRRQTSARVGGVQYCSRTRQLKDQHRAKVVWRIFGGAVELFAQRIFVIRGFRSTTTPSIVACGREEDGGGGGGM